MRKVVFKTIFTKFSSDSFFGTACTISIRITTLHHKALNNSMEGKSIIESLFCKVHKISTAILPRCQDRLFSSAH